MMPKIMAKVLMSQSKNEIKMSGRDLSETALGNVNIFRVVVALGCIVFTLLASRV